MKLKNVFLAIAAMLSLFFAATQATAGGLAEPIVPYETPTADEFTWSGWQIGASAGKLEYTVDRTETITTTETPEYERDIEAECPVGKDPHWGRKCDVSDYDASIFADIPAGNWNGCDAAVCGYNPGQGGIGWNNLWLENGQDYTFVIDTETVTGEPVTTTSTRSFSDDMSEGTAGIFVSYRYDAGSVVYGGDLSIAQTNETEKTLSVLSGHAGWDLGRFLPYGGAGIASFDDDQFAVAVVGADRALSDHIILGARGVIGQDDFAAIESRISFKF